MFYLRICYTLLLSDGFSVTESHEFVAISTEDTQWKYLKYSFLFEVSVMRIAFSRIAHQHLKTLKVRGFCMAINIFYIICYEEVGCMREVCNI